MAYLTFFGWSVIMVEVDRLSKYGHFMALSHPFTIVGAAQVYFYYMFKLYGPQKKIMSDRDPIFTSTFWKTLWKL